MEHFSTTTDGRKIAIGNVVMIQDLGEDVKDYVVMITEPEEGEDFLTGDSLFEAKFEHQEDAANFYELLKEASITIG
jgi:hypothetical protein